MKLVIEVELDNAAFEDHEGVYEVERILGSVAGRVPDPLRPTNGDLSIHDANGNYIGFARITD